MTYNLDVVSRFGGGFTLSTDDFVRRFNGEALVLDVFLVFLASTAALIPKGFLDLFTLVIYTCWIVLVALTVSQTAKFVVSVVHTLWSALFASIGGIVAFRLGVYRGFAIPDSPFLLVLLALWSIELVFGFLLSPHKWLSFFDRLERSMGYSFRVGLVVFILLIWQLLGNSLKPGYLLIPFILSSAFEGIIVLIQWLVYTDKINRRMFNYLYSVSGRMTGTFGNPIMASEYMVVNLFLSLWFLGSGDLSLTLRIALFIPTYLLTILGLHFTHGRASYLSLSFGTLLLLVFVILGWVEWWMLVLSLLPAVFEIFSKRTRRSLFKRFNFKVGARRSKAGKGEKAKAVFQAVASGESRFVFWKVTLREKSKTILKPEGIAGVNAFFSKSRDRSVLEHVGTLVLDRVHNWFLDFLIEGGLVYLLAFLLVNVVALGGFLASKNALGFVALSSLLISELFGFPVQGNYLLWAFLVGISWPISGGALPPIWSYVTFAALIVLFFVNLIAMQLNKRAYTSMKLSTLAKSLAEQGYAKSTVETLNEMVHLCPWSSDLYLWYAGDVNNLFSGSSADAKFVVSELNKLNRWMEFVEKESSEFPNFAVIASNFALSLRDLKTNVDVVELSRKWLDRALEKYPLNIRCRWMKALTLKIKGQLEEAYTILKDLVGDLARVRVKNFEEEDPIWQEFFNTALELGKSEDAKRFLEVYKERFKNILDLFEIIKRISQLFKTPVEWRVLYKTGRDPDKRVVGKDFGKASKVISEWIPKGKDSDVDRIQLVVSEDAKIPARKLELFCSALEDKFPALKSSYRREMHDDDDKGDE